MPGLSGLGLQQMLSAKSRTMPIIMISGCADIPMAVQAMSAGALDFLEKPFNRRALLSRIQEAIDKRGAKLICVDPRFTQSASDRCTSGVSGFMP